jgi:5-methylthioadenosine/S-adenosylhomocysteine deaminase
MIFFKYPFGLIPRKGMRTIVRAKYVIGYNGNDHVIFKNGAVVFEGDTILFVGQDFKGEADQTIDAGNAIVSPGFIDLNALGDIDHDLIHLEAPPEISRNLLWSEEYYLKGSHEVMSPQEEAFKSLYAYTQLITHGITTAMPITSVFYKKWAETYAELEAAVHHAGKLGLRIYLGPSYQSGTRVVKPDGSIEVVWDEEEGKKGLQRAMQFVKNFDGAYDGRIRGMLAPERIETQTPRVLQESKRYSDELGCPIRLHAAQGAFEYGWIRKQYHKTPIQFLAELGFLGSRTSIPHATYIPGYSDVTDGAIGDDLALLSESKTSVIHCPLVIGRHGRALETFRKYTRAGVNLALGTDTFPPDMFQNIRLGSSMARAQDKANSYYADFFRAATLGGARALGRQDLGRLAPGAKADLIIIDLNDFHFGLMDDPVRTLMISASGKDVKTSIIDGRIVMNDRKIEGIDFDALQQQGQAYYDKMKLGYCERDYQHLPQEKLFPPSFQMIE